MGKYCSNCGSELHAGARFCAKCGAAVRNTPENPASVTQPKSVPQPQHITYAQPQNYTPPVTTQKRNGGRNTLCIVLSALLVVQIAAVTLYGWPGVMVGRGANSANGGNSVNGGNGRSGQGTGPDLAQLSTAKAMEASLVQLMERLSDESASGGMNLNAAFGIPADLFSYNSAELSLTLEKEEKEQMIYGQRSIMAKNGDSEHSMSLYADGETMNAGVFFQSSDMIVQNSDASRPIIRYTLASEDASAMSGLAAMERYQLCLRTDTPAQGVNMDWAAALSGAGDIFAAHESEIVTATESVTAGVNGFEAKTSSLTLSEAEAAQTLTALLVGWQRDFHCRDMLSMNDLLHQKKEDQSTMEQLSTLSAADGAALSIKTGFYQNKSALFELTYFCSAGECAMTLLFWEEGEDSYSSLHLRLPSGDSFVYVDTAFAASNSTAHTFYAADGTKLAESLLNSTGSGDGNDFSSEFSYSMTDYTDEDKPQGKTMSSSGSYSHSVSGKSVNGSFSGSLLMSTSKDSEPIPFSGTVTLSEDYGQPVIPKFIEGSGKTVANRLELFAALIPEPEEDEEPIDPAEIARRFDKLPGLMLPLSANMMLFEM